MNRVNLNIKKPKEIDILLKKELAADKKTVEAMEANQYWLTFLDSRGNGVWDWNANTNEVIYSKGWKSMLGYEEAEIKNSFNEWEQLIHPEDKVSVSLNLKMYMEGLVSVYENEHRLLTKNGAYIWIFSRGEIISWTKEGKPLRVIGTHSDINSRKLMEQEIIEAKERFCNVLENSHDASYRKNSANNNYDYMSPVMEELTGFTSEETMVMSDDTVLGRIHPDDLQNVVQLMKEVSLKDYTSESIEYRFLCKNGQYRWFLDRFTWINGDMSQPHYRCGVIQDITSQKLIKAEIEEAKRLAEEASTSKSEFIANMSHELRTPLNVNLAEIQLLQLYLKDDKYVQKEKINKHLRSMKRNCMCLIRLVNNLIDTTKIDGGFYKPHFSNKDIVGLIKRIVLSVLPYMKQKDINLLFSTDIEKLSIICDANMIERIILNIISNAIKFTKDSININICNKIDTVIISVKDNGIGIKEEDQDIIFERYKQVSKLLTRENEGCGIGLSLTKALVEMHGGNISVKSECGSGSDFIVELPVNPHSGSEGILHNVINLYDDDKFIEKMNVEFSAIYLGD